MKRITLTVSKILCSPLDGNWNNFDNVYSANLPTKLSVDDLGTFEEIMQNHESIRNFIVAWAMQWPLSYKFKKGDWAMFNCKIKSSKYGARDFNFIVGGNPNTQKDKETGE